MKQNGFLAEVIKTSIVNVDDSSHGLPPYNGKYSEYKVADYFCPEEWSNDGVFIPVKEGDPLWFDFRGNDECAILCAVQRINPATGEPADLEGGLTKDPTQNYLRMPEQEWLDGYAKEGKVYQFVVTKAGIGLAVNEYVLPKHMQDSHAIGFAFFGPKNPKPKPTYPTRTSGMSYPMWFSPTHTSQNWIGSKSKSVKYGSFGGGQHLNSCGGGSETMGFTPESGTTESISDSVTHGLDGGDAAIFCCNSTDELADPLILGESSDNARFTQNRVAEDVEDTVDDMLAQKGLDTVDILAEQEANLNELDKASMGAGGRITQEIVTDDNTTDYYHEKRSALLTIYFALPEMYDAIMKKGRRQDASKKDKYKTSGHIGGVAVPLINQETDQ